MVFDKFGNSDNILLDSIGLYTLLFEIAMFFFTYTWKDVTMHFNAHFGESSGPYHLSGLRCGGYEANLLNCSRRYTTGGVNNLGIGVHNCAPGNEAGVKCDGMCVHVIDTHRQ